MMKPGDWMCPNLDCQNSKRGVFAKHQQCPQCGCPKEDMPAPQRGGNRGGEHEDDWQCPNTTCLNHEKMVFGKHESCPKCGSLKDAGGGNGEGRPGDWKCPNAACVNNRNAVFGKHDRCPKCGSPRPGRGMQGGRPGQQIYQRPLTMMGGFQAPSPRPFPQHRITIPAVPMMNPGAAYGAPQLAQMAGVREGDWQCPNTDCVNNRRAVFGKNSSCPACGTMRGAKKPGDWQCPNPDCQNNRNGVFAKNEECPKCGSAKPIPPLAPNRQRSRSPRR